MQYVKQDTQRQRAITTGIYISSRGVLIVGVRKKNTSSEGGIGEDIWIYEDNETVSRFVDIQCQCDGSVCQI